MTDPGPRIAGGRSADIYAIGDGRVVRRRRSGPIQSSEVAAMRLAHEHGFPVPEVFGVDGADMTMERIDGDDLLALLKRRPWRARRVGRLLADLHRALAAVPCDARTIDTSVEPGEAIVHGDLHPGNVLMTSHGPVVIDWENASRGPRDADVVTTWLLMTVADADDVPLAIRPLLASIRRAVIRAFLDGVDPPRAATVSAVCDGRLADPNLRPHEMDGIRRFRSRHGEGASTGGGGHVQSSSDW